MASSRSSSFEAESGSAFRENAEVVGSDESFFEDDMDEKPILDLYNEKSGILEDTDTEVDLASYAYQIWKNATDADPKLKKIIADLPNVVFSTKPHTPTADQPEGVLVYMRTGEGNDSLAWIDAEGEERYRIPACYPESRRVRGRHPSRRHGFRTTMNSSRRAFATWYRKRNQSVVNWAVPLVHGSGFTSA